VLVQVRRAPQKSKGGIALPDEAKSNEQWNASVAKVLAVGPLAFKKRDTMADWPEGVWASVGDFVRAPRYGGDRWEIAISDGSKVLVAVFNDHELIGRIEGDPLSMRGYV
jgi:co-chaperonin GroES (HSP10)